jgi:hypothetical protein
MVHRATQIMAESPDFKARGISVVAVTPGWWWVFAGRGLN